LIATSASAGAAAISTATPTSPPATEKTRFTPILRLSWPFSVMA
jgi:hypothetical protein